MITSVIFWSTAYFVITFHTAKLFGLQGKSLQIATFAGIVVGAIRGFYG
jgi:hypothetical protein